MSQTAGNKKQRSDKTSRSSDGGGDEVSIKSDDGVTTVKDRKPSDKKPLHSSMEQLQVHCKTTVNRRAAGSNWNTVQVAAKPTESTSEEKEENPDGATVNNVGDKSESNAENAAPPVVQSKSARLRQKRKIVQRNKYVAMDCEMVGVGSNGHDDMLARVSIVNKQGEVLLDKFVKPREEVTDYRTSISGIRPRDIENGENFASVQQEVIQLLQGKILVGHAIRNDLAVLNIKHPYVSIRDTSRYKPLCRLVANGRTPSLKRVCQAILGQEIQIGEHNSVEDARAAMNIYKRLSADWEKFLQRNHRH